MNRDTLHEELHQAQSLVHALVEQNPDIYNRQTDPALSPLGWHLGHCVFIECYWLQEVILGDRRVTAPLADLYIPPRTPKAERGKKLPTVTTLLDWSQQEQANNRRALQDAAGHELFENDYLLHFLIQHYCQHYETMLMILTRKALAADTDNYRPLSPLQSAAVTDDFVSLPAGRYRIGGQPPVAYDNELPLQHAELGPFSIRRTPVSNAEYLHFMEADGYRRSEFWSQPGWLWQQENNCVCPDHWRQDPGDNWYATGVHGPCDLAADEPVMGLSHHEACAFASWAGARLPHEYQWETACRLQALQLTGSAWEWCRNTFHPYDGFKAFPYDEYSGPWFDGEHFTLRGGSLYTRPAIKRPSFRNFYQADKRYIFAGLRLSRYA